MATSEKMRIAVLISGGGTTLLNLAECLRDGRLDVSIDLVISSSASAKGLDHARKFDISQAVITEKACGTPEAFSQTIFDQCRQANIDLVVMGGFLKHLLIPADFENRVTNIHPSLIPAFCGKGFYGSRVHQAVIDYGAKITGCTVHFVDNEYDHGPIILQKCVSVQSDDSAKDLASRVFDAECEAYPEAIQAIADQRVVIDGRRVTIQR